MENKQDRTVLLIEDQPKQTSQIRAMLDQVVSDIFRVAHVESIGDAERHLARSPVEVVLLDLGMREANGIAGPDSSTPRCDSVALRL